MTIKWKLFDLSNNDSSYKILVRDAKNMNQLSMSSTKIWRNFTEKNNTSIAFRLTYVVRQGCAKLYVNFKYNSASSNQITQSENVKSL